MEGTSRPTLPLLQIRELIPNEGPHIICCGSSHFFFFKETLQCRDYTFISEPRKLCLRVKKLVSVGKWQNWNLNLDHAILAFPIIPCEVLKLRGSARSQQHISWLLLPEHFIPYPAGFWEGMHLYPQTTNFPASAATGAWRSKGDGCW